MPSTTHCYCCSATRRARTRASPNVTRYHRVIKGLFFSALRLLPPPTAFNGISCSSHSLLRGTCAALDNCPPLHLQTSGDHKSVRHCLRYVPLSSLSAASSCIRTGRSPTLHQRRDLLLFLRNNNNPVEWGSARKTATFIPDSGHKNAPKLFRRRPLAAPPPPHPTASFFIFYSFSGPKQGQHQGGPTGSRRPTLAEWQTCHWSTPESQQSAGGTIQFKFLRKLWGEGWP
jgi:hypothetical protein